jgi:rod shape-determining protein MreC
VREQRVIIWLVLGALLLLVFNLPESVSSQVKSVLREAVAPLQGALSSFSNKTRESVESVRGIGGAVAENRKMSAELVRLRNEVRRLETLELQNITLREQLRFAQTSARDLIPSEVIARDISGWWQTIRLGKGLVDGVTANRAVVTTDGLVGKTVATSPHTADVLLVSDPGCKVSTQITRTGLFGVLTGQGTSWRGRVVCRMDFINKDTPVLPGDEVVTSGLGGVFPKGLLVGYVDRVEEDESGLYQRAYVVPKADLGGLTYAFVVVQKESAVEELLRRRGLRGEAGE